MAKIPKIVMNKIEQMAKVLPAVAIDTRNKLVLTGAQILAQKTINKIDGKPIDPLKKYISYSTQKVEWNHCRRLKKAWLDGRYDGIKNYVSTVQNIVNKNKKLSNGL